MNTEILKYPSRDDRRKLRKDFDDNVKGITNQITTIKNRIKRDTQKLKELETRKSDTWAKEAERQRRLENECGLDAMELCIKGHTGVEIAALLETNDIQNKIKAAWRENFPDHYNRHFRHEFSVASQLRAHPPLITKKR